MAALLNSYTNFLRRSPVVGNMVSSGVSSFVDTYERIADDILGSVRYWRWFVVF